MGGAPCQADAHSHCIARHEVWGDVSVRVAHTASRHNSNVVNNAAEDCHWKEPLLFFVGARLVQCLYARCEIKNGNAETRKGSAFRRLDSFKHFVFRTVKKIVVY